MCLSVIQSAREKSPVVSYHRKRIFPASDLANRSKLRLLGSGKSQQSDVSTPKTRTCKRCRFDRLSQMPDWNAGMPHLRVRRSGRRPFRGRLSNAAKAETKSLRQSKNKTAIGKSTKSIAIKWWRICHHFMEREEMILKRRLQLLRRVT